MTGGAPTPGPAIQKASINQLRQFGGDELIQKVVATFLATAPERIKAIRAGIVASDAAKISGEAHSLKSSSGQLGALKLAELCEQAEQDANSRKFDGMAALSGALETEFARVRAELAQFA